jgi:hypothetical protein
MSFTEGSKFQEQIEDRKARRPEPTPPPMRTGLASDSPFEAGKAAIQRDDIARLKELTKEFNQLCNRLALDGVHVETELDCPSIFLHGAPGPRTITTLRTAAWRKL